MTLVCELPSILQDINDKNELINYGETWRKLHAKVPPPLNQGDSLASRGAQDDKNSKRTGATGQLRPTTSSILQPTHDSRSGIPLAHRNSEPVLGHGSSAAKGRGVASKDRKDTEDDNFHLLSVTAAYLPTMLAKRHEHSNGHPISRTTTSRRRPPLTSAANAALLHSVPPQLLVDDSNQDDPNSPSDPMRTASPSPWGNDDYDMPLSAMYSTHSVQMAIAKTIPDTSVPNRLSQPSETERQWTAAIRDQEELALLEQRKATAKNDREAALQAQHLFILQQLQHLQEQQHRLLQQFQDIQLTYQAEFHQPLQLPKTMPLPNLPPLVLPSTMGKKFPHIVVGSHSASAGIGSHGRMHSMPAQHPDEIPRLAYPVLKAHHLPLPKPIFHAAHPSPRDLLPKASSKSELKAKLEGSEKSHHKASTLPSPHSTHPTGSMHKTNSESRVKNPGQEDESSEDEVGTRSRQHVSSRGGAHANSSEHGADANSRDPHTSSTRYTSAQQQEMQRGAHQQAQHGNHNPQAAANQQQQQLQAQYVRQQQYAATAVAPVPHPHQPPPQQTQYNGRARLVFFTQHNEGPITTVHKEVAHYPAPRESGLSRLFAIVEVYVFVPHRKKPLVLRVPQTTNFGQLSAVAIKTRNSTPKLPPNRRLEENPDAYYVRIAGRNGQPDERYPGVLSKRNGNIESWLRFAFCLVENPEYKARMTEPPQEQKVHLTVFLPSGSYNVLLVDANTKMKKVLQMICAKRQLTAANFMLMVEQMSYESDSQSESDVGELEWQSIPGSVRVGDLESTAVTLVQKTGVATLQGEEAWYTGFAAQQKTYSHIIFLKKKNLGSSSKEKSASLDIDQDSITVTVIRKKRQPKTFKVPFETIVAVHQSENKPTQFHIECQDHRTLMFEAPNPVMAKEIIFRIQFLIDMESEARALAMANPVN